MLHKEHPSEQIMERSSNKVLQKRYVIIFWVRVKGIHGIRKTLVLRLEWYVSTSEIWIIFVMRTKTKNSPILIKIPRLEETKKLKMNAQTKSAE